MGQKLIHRFWWESWLSSTSRNHLITFCRPFVGGNKATSLDVMLRKA